MSERRATAIVVAGGKGVRMGGDLPKQYMQLRGRPVMWHTLMCFERAESIASIVVVVRAEDLQYCHQEVLGDGLFCKVRAVVAGGAERADSVRAGLEATESSDEIILVHDAVRPFVSAELIGRVVAAAAQWGAALPCLPVKETIKVVDGKWVRSTPQRQTLQGAQTPQGFRRDILSRAHAADRVPEATDDAMLVEDLGLPVRVVAGEEVNRKLTTPADWAWAQHHLAEEEHMAKVEMRVGQGYDVHRLGPDRRLVLGGVEVPFHLGLEGHSDADVLTHAIIDALVGAIGEGDIGRLFPDDDAQYENISSLILLQRVGALLAQRGAEIVNVDAVVMAQRPKLAPHIDAMRAALAEVLGVELATVSIKATTTERLGFVGREEGMAAQAVALVRL